MRKLINDEAGFIISAEFVLVLTIAVLGMVVGLASMRDSLTGEFTARGGLSSTIEAKYP